MSYQVGDVYNEVRKILGSCGRDTIYEYITNSVEALANTGDFDPLIGFVDLCVTGDTVTLPREIDTILAVNVGGEPSIGRDQFYRFHLNGLGDCRKAVAYQWEDKGAVCTYRELAAPSKVVAYITQPEDAGSEFWVYGFDTNGDPVRVKEGDNWIEGYRVPTIYGNALPDADAPIFSRITRVRKSVTAGPVRLASFDGTATSGALIGSYEPTETTPEYRRIKINVGGCGGVLGCASESGGCGWVRVAYRKRIYAVAADSDLIPLPSKLALLFMVRALKAYNEDDIQVGAAHEANARRILTEATWAHSPVVQSPVVVNENITVGSDRRDFFVD